jgi:integrase
MVEDVTPDWSGLKPAAPGVSTWTSRLMPAGTDVASVSVNALPCCAETGAIGAILTTPFSESPAAVEWYGYLRILRQVYAFAIDNRLATVNPANRVKVPAAGRSDRLCPFQSWDEVERVAEETGRWAPLVVFAVDTGARPGELAHLEHRHVRGNRVYLPGTKTRTAERVVTLTHRGLAASRSLERSDRTALVFHKDGRPVDFDNWRNRVWQPALERAALQKRGVYAMRHTFAYFSLIAGVPISDVATEMGHRSSALTYTSYGHWSNAMGDRAARLRSAWDTPPPPSHRHPEPETVSMR